MFTSPLELVFLLDVSESLSSIDIDRIKTLVKEVLATYLISPEKVRVAFILSGASKSNTNKVVLLGEGESMKTLKDFVNSISKGTGERDFVKGLRLVSSDVFNTNFRTGALTFVIAITGAPFPNKNEYDIKRQLLVISRKYNLLLTGINKHLKTTASYGGDDQTMLTNYVNGRDIPEIYASIYKSLSNLQG